MARQILDGWIPVQRGDAVITAVNSTSAVEALARPEPMTTDTKEVPRSGGTDLDVIGKGSAYTEAEADDDMVTLKARKFVKAFRLAEEDIADIPEDILAQRQLDWANAYAKSFDNACLATTGAENGLTVPFTSVYRTLATADAGQGYTAGANIIKSAGAVTYDHLSSVLGLVENGDYFGDVVVIAHPSFKGAFRGLKDSTGSPIFVQGLGESGQDSLFGYSVAWSAGARTSAGKFTASPAGNPLLVVANRSLLVKGVRSGPEFRVISADVSLTDEAVLKGRARRGFALGHTGGAAVLEVTAGA